MADLILKKNVDIHADELDSALMDDLRDCTTPGQDATESVQYVIQNYSIEYDAADIRGHLYDLGAWDDDELEDEQENLVRLVWVMAGGIVENGSFYLDYFPPVDGE